MEDLNIVDDTKIGRLGWVGHTTRKEDERIQKRRLLVGNSTTHYQQEEHEQNGNTASRVMHYRSQECEDGGDELGVGVEAPFKRGQGPGGTVVLYMDAWMDGATISTEQYVQPLTL